MCYHLKPELCKLLVAFASIVILDFGPLRGPDSASSRFSPVPPYKCLTAVFFPNSSFIKRYTVWWGKAKGKVVHVRNYACATPWRRGSGGIAPPLLTSAVGVGEWSASHPGYFTPGKFPRYPLNRTLSGPQSRYGRCEEKSCLFQDSIHSRSACSRSLYWLGYPEHYLPHLKAVPSFRNV
jgi:hypothetical protein